MPRSLVPSSRFDIQLLRGIAVLGVLGFHFVVNRFPNGYLGVDMFFVISGFVLSKSIYDIFEPSVRNRDLLAAILFFTQKRIVRLAPALCGMVILILPLVFFLALPEDIHKSALQAIASIFMVANWAAPFLSGNYFNPNSNAFLHTWSLSVEEQLYISVPIMMFIFSTLISRKSQVLNLWLWFLFLLSLSLYFSQMAFPWDLLNKSQVVSNSFYYSTFSRMWQFLLGLLAFQHFSRLRSNLSSFTPYVWSMGLLTLVMGLGWQIALDKTIGGLLVTFSTVVCIIAAPKIQSRLLLLGFLKWFGDRSYSIYLYHFPLVFLVHHSTLFGSSLMLRRFSLALALIFTLSLASLSYKYLEKPFMHRKMSSLTLKMKPNRFLALALFLCVTLALGKMSNYWHLDKIIKYPPVAWELNSPCKRMLVNETRPTPCILKQSANFRPTVLLVGDSFAAQFSQVLLKIAKSSDYTFMVWSQADCRPTATTAKRKNLGKCESHNRAVIDWTQKYRPDIVIVGNYVSKIEDLDPMKQFLLELSQSQSKILVLGNIPIFPDESTFMRSQPILKQIMFVPAKPRTIVSVAEMVQRPRLLSEQLSAWVEKSSFDNLDLFSVFCSTSKCKRYESGRWLYWGNRHLSLAGAELAEPLFTQYLRENLVKISF